MDGRAILALHGMRPSIASAAWPVAILYAIGAYWIVYSLAVGLFAISSFIVRPPVSGLYLPSAVLAGSAAAAAVALRSGGWISVIGLAVAAVAYVLVLDCRGSSAATGTCGVDLGWIAQRHVAEVLGMLAGVVLAFGLRRRDGRSALLLAAAIFAIVFSVLRVGFALLEPVTGSPAYERFLWATGLQAVAALAAGAVLGWMARRRTWALLTIGAALLLPWLGGTFHHWWQGQMELRAAGFVIHLSTIIQTDWVFFRSPIYLALVLIGFAAALAVARQRSA